MYRLIIFDDLDEYLSGTGGSSIDIKKKEDLEKIIDIALSSGNALALWPLDDTPEEEK